MMMTARALLNKNPSPSEHEIREAISGQICRCTGYATIVRSIQWAAANESAAATDSAGADTEAAGAAVPVGGTS
jgi:carbon-monoxide dehydrogenase small subunit